MAEREVELAEAHKRCPFVTMGQHFNTWHCGLAEQFGWKYDGLCLLQMGGGKCNPVDKIKSRIEHLEGEIRLAKRLLIEAKDVDTSYIVKRQRSRK